MLAPINVIRSVTLIFGDREGFKYVICTYNNNLQAVLYLSRSNKTFRVTAQLESDVYLNGRP